MPSGYWLRQKSQLAYKTSLKKSESIETPLFEYLFKRQAFLTQGYWIPKP